MFYPHFIECLIFQAILEIAEENTFSFHRLKRIFRVMTPVLGSTNRQCLRVFKVRAF